MPQVLSRPRAEAGRLVGPGQGPPEGRKAGGIVGELLVGPLPGDHPGCREADLPFVLQDSLEASACLLVFEPWCRIVPDGDAAGVPALDPADIRSRLMPILQETVLPALAERHGVEGEARRDGAAAERAAEAALRTEACADRLYAAVVGGGQGDALEAVRELSAEGEEGVERILCLVLPAVAARLDTAVRADDCSETERTVAICMLRRLVDRLGDARPAAVDAPAVLLWAPAGEPVGLDLSLLAAHLRRSGMVVESHEGDAPAAVVDEVGRGGADALVVWAATATGAGRAVDLAEAVEDARCGCEVVGLGESVRAARDGAPCPRRAPSVLAATAEEARARLRSDLARGRRPAGADEARRAAADRVARCGSRADG